MQKSDEDWIVKTIGDFMIEEKDIHKFKSFSITAYSNSNQYKIPVLFKFEEEHIQHIVIDYAQKKILDDCLGLHTYEEEEYIRLDCDIRDLMEIGYVDYYPNEKITKLLNAALTMNS